MTSDDVQSAVSAVAGMDARLRWSICVRDPSGTVVASHDAAHQMSTASVGKLLLLIEVARRCEGSPAFGEQTLGRSGIDPVGDSGLLQYLGVERLSVVDLAVLVASVSDNLATNVLLQAVGLAAVDDLARALGLRVTALLDQVRDERRPEHAPALSHGSAEELSRLIVEIGTGKLLSPAVSAQLRHWLSTGVDLSLVGSAFGLDPLAHMATDGDIALFHKTGSDEGVRADIGMTTGAAGALGYAAIANWNHADAGLLEAVLQGMRRLGAALRRETTN
jgi:beta-lactamase class A